MLKKKKSITLEDVWKLERRFPIDVGRRTGAGSKLLPKKKFRLSASGLRVNANITPAKHRQWHTILINKSVRFQEDVGIGGKGISYITKGDQKKGFIIQKVDAGGSLPRNPKAKAMLLERK